MRRAAHQLFDEPPLVFTDPLALQILPEEARVELHAREAMERSHPFARGMRAFMCARSRFAEDALEAAIAGGVRQYVVLGAGLDTYAGRSSHPGLRIFEMDHPATQAWKQQRLEQGGIQAPASVTFVAVDFERETLIDRLIATDFDVRIPTFCSWLGVLPYLTHGATEETLRALGGLAHGSGVAFDYAVPRSALSPAEQAAFDWLAERVASSGEAFQPGFEPAELRALLLQSGYTRVEELDSDVINARYFAGRTDGLMVRGGLGRLVCAWRD
jgi:methyltransferase (TIGR00027 family)